MIIIIIIQQGEGKSDAASAVASLSPKLLLPTLARSVAAMVDALAAQSTRVGAIDATTTRAANAAAAATETAESLRRQLQDQAFRVKALDEQLEKVGAMGGSGSGPVATASAEYDDAWVRALAKSLKKRLQRVERTVGEGSNSRQENRYVFSFSIIIIFRSKRMTEYFITLI